VLDGVLVALVLLLAFEIGFFPARNSDLLLHRAVGRDVSHGTFDFHSDPYSYTTEGATWVDHSWLFGVFAYGMTHLGDWGTTALIVLKSLLLAALAELMLRVARRPGQTIWVPALCVGLAVLALSARTLLQPVCLSYLFLGLTLYLLEFPRRRAATSGAGTTLPLWNVRWLIVPLCALWVNLDAWFVLGPALAGLYLVGELLEGAKAPRGSVGNLGAVLAASVLACLASPYHVYAFTLPDQLGLSPAARELEKLIAPTLIGPWQGDYLNSPSTPAVYRSVAGLCYYPLVFISLASFVRLPGSWRNWRGPVWLGFFLLSSWHARAIPFFAIVAGPIMSLNFLDYNALTAAADVPADMEGRRRRLTVRLLTALLAFAAFTAGSAGWLHTPLWGPDFSGDSRRPGWWEDFDMTQVNSAQKLAEWRERKLVPDDVRPFNTALDAVNFLAWYAPGIRGFMDNRYSLYSAETAHDYLDALTDLRTKNRPPERANAPADAPAWDSVFNSGKVAYVLVGEGDVTRRGLRFIPSMLSNSEEWTPCYLYGGAAIFGWNKATGRGPKAYEPIRYDARQLAFGLEGKAETAPQQRPVPLPDPTWYEIIWQPQRPRSSETDNAYIHLLANNRQEDQRNEEEAHLAVIRQIVSAGFPGGSLVNGSFANQLLYTTRVMHDPGPPADLYLAVRAARRALNVSPEDGRAWFRLGQAYGTLAKQSRERGVLLVDSSLRELREAQMVGALTRAVRFNTEVTPETEQAHVILAEYFQNWFNEVTGRRPTEPDRFVDLVLIHREGQYRVLKAQLDAQAARGVDSPELQAAREYLQRLEAEVQRLQQAKKDQDDRFELDSANKSAFERARLAFLYGLIETAIKAGQEHLQQMYDGSVDQSTAGPGVELTLRLMITTGQMDEARLLVQSEETRRLLGMAAAMQPRDKGLPVLPLQTGEWYRIVVDAVSGDYADADETLKELVKYTNQVPFGPDGKLQSPGVFVAMGIGDELLTRAAEVGRVTGVVGRLAPGFRRDNDRIRPWPSALQSCILAEHRDAELQTVRGWLAVESGDIETAKEELTAVTKRAAAPDSLIRGYRSRRLAVMLLEWIQESSKP
jgi:hypothetical protein